MNIETIQNIVLFGMGALILFMYITSKALDQISDDLEAQDGANILN